MRDEDGDLPLDLLAHGGDRPSGFMRLRARIRETRTVAVARRHPWRSRAVVAGILAAAGAATFFVTRPPPPPPPPPLVVVSGYIEGSGEPDPDLGSSTVATTVVVSGVTPGQVQVIGIAGPGVTPVPPVGLDEGQALITDTSDQIEMRSTVDCTQPDWWGATDSDYQLLVRRTDEHAQVSEVAVPLGGGFSELRAFVQRSCLRDAVVALPMGEWTVDVTPGTPDVQVSLRVTNPNVYPLWLQPSSGGFREPADGTVFRLDPGQTETVRFSSQVSECESREGLPPYLVPSGSGSVLELSLQADLAELPPSPTDNQHLVTIRLAAQLSSAVDREIGLACQGAPSVTTKVTGVRTLSVDEPSLSWGIDVAVTVAADAITFPDDGGEAATPPFNEPWVSLPARAEVHGGVARFRLNWTTPDCETLGPSGVGGPPSTPATVVVDGRRYPTDLSFSDARLLAAVRAACPGLISDSDAVDMGWPGHA